MAGTSSQRSELSVSCMRMVYNVWEVDISGLAKNWLRELVGFGWLRIEIDISIMTIELD